MTHVITDVPGLRVGHWTDAAARTGCTVVLFPEGTVASGEVRGGAPATREFALLEPTRTVARLDALVLTGGSAFGLASADGVVRFCEERGMGFPTPAGPVPIVVGARAVRPRGRRPVRAARGRTRATPPAWPPTPGPSRSGLVGAGTGATVSGVQAVPEEAMPVERRPGGLVTAGARVGDLVVAALVAVNAAGVPGAGDDLARGHRPHRRRGPRHGDRELAAGGTMAGFGNTTIGARGHQRGLDKVGCHLVAQSAHDGLARAVFPAHTRADGDAFVAAAVGRRRRRRRRRPGPGRPRRGAGHRGLAGPGRAGCARRRSVVSGPCRPGPPPAP